jgi:hypothetical protein
MLSAKSVEKSIWPSCWVISHSIEADADLKDGEVLSP